MVEGGWCKTKSNQERIFSFLKKLLTLFELYSRAWMRDEYNILDPIHALTFTFLFFFLINIELLLAIFSRLTYQLIWVGGTRGKGKRRKKNQSMTSVKFFPLFDSASYGSSITSNRERKGKFD